MPKVTVLMPVYNGERFLKEAINSILNQAFSNYEFLIIDDGSSDSSPEIINSFNDRRIRLIKNEKNIGQMSTLNKGVKLSREEYIARIDQDDISLADRLKKQVEILDKNKNVHLVFTDTYIIDSKGQRRKKTILNKTNPEIKCSFERFLKGEFFICQCTTMIRKKIFDVVGLYNPLYKIAAEHELYHFRLLYNHEIEFIKEPLTEYRLYANNATSNIEQTAGEILDMLMKFKKNSLSEFQKNLLNKAISGQLATLSLCELFAHRRKSSIRSALKAIGKDRNNIKAYSILGGALLLPAYITKILEKRRRKYLGEDSL